MKIDAKTYKTGPTRTVIATVDGIGAMSASDPAARDFSS